MPTAAPKAVSGAATSRQSAASGTDSAGRPIRGQRRSHGDGDSTRSGLHGGHISAESDVGKGATFYVVLPAASADAIQAA